MTLIQAKELQVYGETMNVKVDIRDSRIYQGYAVQFFRLRIDEFNRAAMHLRHYEMTAFPENHIHLVG